MIEGEAIQLFSPMNRLVGLVTRSVSPERSQLPILPFRPTENQSEIGMVV
jgi:hypothetical protein